MKSSVAFSAFVALFAETTLAADYSHPSMLETAKAKNFLSKTKNNKSAKLSAKQFGATDAKFSPEDDPSWPGAFPSSFGSEHIMINIRVDQYVSEILLFNNSIISGNPNFGNASGNNGTSMSKVVSKGKQASGDLVSIPMEFPYDETLYRIELIDTAGDGICCGESGNGWVTITDKTQNVLWSQNGDYTFAAAAYLFVDVGGAVRVEGSTGGGGNPTPTPSPPTSPTGPTPTPPPPVPSPTPPAPQPTLRPVNPPLAAECTLCPDGGDVAWPDIAFEGSSGEVTCGGAQTDFEFLTASTCSTFEEDGTSAFYQIVCQCPGFEPSCRLCPGGETINPEEAIQLGDGEPVECRTLELVILTSTEEDCDDFDDATLSGLGDLCECS